jgi:sugar phosphate permease
LVVAIFEAAGILGTLSSGFVIDRFFGGRECIRTSQASRITLSLISLILFLTISTMRQWLYICYYLWQDFTYSVQIQVTTGSRKACNIRNTTGVTSGIYWTMCLFKCYFIGFRVEIITQNFGWMPALLFLSDSLICMGMQR